MTAAPRGVRKHFRLDPRKSGVFNDCFVRSGIKIKDVDGNLEE
jgi:hypothetical protein